MSDMRDDLDVLGRQLWPATDALRPRQTRATLRQQQARRWWRLEPLATVAAAVLLIGVIGGAVVLGRSLSSRTPSISFPGISPPPVTPGGTTPVPAQTTAPSATAQVVVWAAASQAGTVVRVGATTGAFHTIATLPADTRPVVLGAGGHRVLFWEGVNGHLFDLDINTGAVTDHGGAVGDTFQGAAFAADGSSVEYLRKADPGSAEIRFLDFTSGVISGVRTFASGPFDVPVVRAPAGLAATLQPLGSASSTGMTSAAFVLLDPSTGSPITATTGAFASWAIAADGAHAAAAVGLPPVSGTLVAHQLVTAVIGSPPRVVRNEDANHYLAVEAVSADGSTVLYADLPAKGEYADITHSPDYGLFTLSGGQRRQLEHVSGGGATYVGAAYVGGRDFVALLQTAPSTTHGSTSLEYETGTGPPAPLDTQAGGGAFVAVVTGQ